MGPIPEVSLPQCTLLCRLVLSSKEGLERRIRSSYSESWGNFAEVESTLEVLGLIECQDSIVRPTPILTSTQSGNENRSPAATAIASLVKDLLLTGSSEVSNHVREFLSHFAYSGAGFEFSPSIDENLRYANVRNLLIELDVVFFDEERHRYVLLEDPLGSNRVTGALPRVTREQFAQMLEKRDAIGREAELEAIEFERHRLVDHPDLVRQIVHVADVDVGAGFDVLSYDVNCDGTVLGPRYIEVKAVGRQQLFFLSANELDAARQYRRSYYLYLVHVDSHMSSGTAKVTIYRDPLITVITNEEEWKQQIETTKIQKQAVTKSTKDAST